MGLDTADDGRTCVLHGDRAPNLAETGEQDLERLIFFGEALSAAEECGGLGHEIRNMASDVHACLNASFDTLKSADRVYTKHDFALFFLSRMIDLDLDAARYQDIQVGALRYLRDNRTQLSPDLAALEAEAGPGAETVGNVGQDAGGMTWVHENAGPGNPALASASPNDFVRAFESVRQEWSKAPRPVRAVRSPDEVVGAPSDPNPTVDPQELERLRVRRRRVIGELREQKRRRARRLLIPVLWTGLLLAPVLTAVLIG